MRGAVFGLVVIASCGWPPPPPPDVAELLEIDADRVAEEGPTLGHLRPDEREGNLLWATTPPLALDDDGLVSLTVNLPEGTTSFQLLLGGPAGTLVIPHRVVGPDETVWVDDKIDRPDSGDVARSFGFPSQLRSPGRALAKREAGAWVFPNTPDLPFQSGAWRIEAGAFTAAIEQGVWTPTPAAGALAAAVVIALGEEPLQVPLYVHLAVDDIAADTADAHPVLAPALELFAAGLLEGGIEVEAPRFFDVDPSFRTVVLEDDTCAGGDLDDLMQTTSAYPQGALHLFVVERFRCVIAGGIDVGGQLGGYAPGIPGSGPAVGTRESGVAVAYAFAEEDPTTLAHVMLHEVGHALGLFHTQEAPRFDARDLFDIIADTDEERADENVMYYAAEGATAPAFSEGQAAVMRRHPLALRGEPPGEGGSR